MLNNRPSTKIYDMISKKTGKEFRARVIYEYDPNSEYKNKFTLVFVKERDKNSKKKELVK